ncbi:MAG: PAS domain-containing protein [Longimicrobiales bacterium]|nr:PAS domain-containing protein [Longimicrobiales bacterium]
MHDPDARTPGEGLTREVRAVYDAMPLPVVVFRPTGERIFVNRATRTEFEEAASGFAPEDFVGARWQDIPGTDAMGPAFVAAWRRVTEGGQASIDIPWFAPSSTRHVYRGRLWRSDDGSIHLVAIVTGTVDTAEEALRQLVTHFPFGAWFVFDRELRYLAAHGRALRTSEGSPSELVGRRLDEVWPEELVNQIREPYLRALEGEPSELLVSHEGRVLRHWISPVRGDSEGVSLGAVLVWDITEEVAVQDSLELLHTSIDSLHLGVTLATAEDDLPLVFANRGFERITGYSAEEALGTNCRFLQGPGTDREVVRRIREGIAAARPVQEVILNYRKDGSSFWNRVTLSPIRSDEGEVTHYIGVQEDVSEQRRTGEELDLARRLGALGQLAGGLAHDMRNVLTGTGLTLDLLLERDDLPAEITSELGEVRGVLTRGSSITDRLLAFAREHTFEREPLDLNAFVEGRLGLLRSLLRDSIEVVLHEASDPAWILGNPGQLDQVLLNLATNAEAAMPTGGRFDLVVESGLTRDELGPDGPWAGVNEGRWVRLQVRDSGCGMSPEVLERAFEPFFSTRKTSGGTGLGLSSVYGVVNELGGLCWIESEEGEGTTVHLTFPQLEEGTSDREGTGGASERLAGLRVLLAEDDRSIRRACARFLTSRGARVVDVADGTAGAARLDEPGFEVDLIVTDAVMPGLSGPELIRAARAARPGLPCLLISGYTDVHLPPEFDDIRMLEKPFTVDALARAIEGVLGERV